MSRGIKAVVEIRAEAADHSEALARLGVEHRRLPVDEGKAPSKEEMTEIADWIINEMRAGPVLIHCREGRGRSVLVACAVLVRLGHHLDQAYELVKKAQPAVALSEDQVEALSRFSSGVMTRRDNGA